MWRNPLSFDSDFYVDFHYQQVTTAVPSVSGPVQLPSDRSVVFVCLYVLRAQLRGDYLNGQLMHAPADGSSSVQDIAQLSALQHLAQERMQQPSL